VNAGFEEVADVDPKVPGGRPETGVKTEGVKVVGRVDVPVVGILDGG
jgi:hypothetical protein